MQRAKWGKSVHVEINVDHCLWVLGLVAIALMGGSPSHSHSGRAREAPISVGFERDGENWVKRSWE